MARCPYCDRPLRMGGLKCRVCRRFALRREHVVILLVFGFFAVILLLDIFERLTRPRP